MPASKIQNVQEARQWIEEGRPYAWIIEKYREKYNIETTPAMWSNFRNRQGLERRIVWDENLIPWKVKLEHRYAHPITMLRKEARRRAGFDLSIKESNDVDTWIRQLKENDAVLHYDPETEQGWFYVPRREGIDRDLIRNPDRLGPRSQQRRKAS